jgi:hypothetical protein
MVPAFFSQHGYDSTSMASSMIFACGRMTKTRRGFS